MSIGVWQHVREPAGHAAGVHRSGDPQLEPSPCQGVGGTRVELKGQLDSFRRDHVVVVADPETVDQFLGQCDFALAVRRGALDEGQQCAIAFSQEVRAV